MGSLTRAQLIREALELAGDTSLGTRAAVWLNAALEDLYSSAAWPFLIKRPGPIIEGIGSTFLGQSMGATAFGDGAVVQDRIFKVHKLLWASGTTGSSGRGQITPVSGLGTTPETDPLLGTQLLSGPPAMAILQAVNSPWKWFVEFDRPLDRALRIVPVIQVMPAPLTLDADVPMYPNDMTIIQALVAIAMFHQEDARFGIEEGKKRDLVGQDRVKWLNALEASSTIGLDPTFFKNNSRR